MTTKGGVQKGFRYFLKSGRTPPAQRVFSGSVYPERPQGQEKSVPTYTAQTLLAVTTWLATPLSQPTGYAPTFKCMRGSTDARRHWNEMTRFVLVHRSQADRRDSLQHAHPLHSGDWQIVSYRGQCCKIKTNNSNFTFSFPIQLKIKNKPGWY